MSIIDDNSSSSSFDDLNFDTVSLFDNCDIPPEDELFKTSDNQSASSSSEEHLNKPVDIRPLCWRIGGFTQPKGISWNSLNQDKKDLIEEIETKAKENKELTTKRDTLIQLANALSTKPWTFEKSLVEFNNINEISKESIQTYYEKCLKYRKIHYMCTKYPKMMKEIHKTQTKNLKPVRQMFEKRLKELHTKLANMNKKNPNYDPKRIMRDKQINKLIEYFKKEIVSEMNTMMYLEKDFNSKYEELVDIQNKFSNKTGMTPDQYTSLQKERDLRLEKLKNTTAEAKLLNKQMEKPKTELKPGHCPKQMEAAAKKLQETICDRVKKMGQLDAKLKEALSYERNLRLEVETYPKLKAMLDNELKTSEETICKLVELSERQNRCVGQTNQLFTLTSPSLSETGKSQHHICVIAEGAVTRPSTIHVIREPASIASLNTPVLDRSPKLSNVAHGWYLDR
ncbi:hypothetical protein WDU94_006632 [Cyamophila willieti]